MRQQRHPLSPCSRLLLSPGLLSPGPRGTSTDVDWALWVFASPNRLLGHTETYPSVKVKWANPRSKHIYLVAVWGEDISVSRWGLPAAPGSRVWPLD